MILHKIKSINTPIIEIRTILQFNSFIVKYSINIPKNIGIVEIINRILRIMYFLRYIKLF